MMNLKINYLILLLSLTFMEMTYSSSSHSIQYLYPKNNASWIVKESPIIIRFQKIKPDQITNLESFIQIRGEQSGHVQGRTVVSTDQKTIIYYPENPFQSGELVTVKLKPYLDGQSESFVDTTITFFIAPVEAVFPEVEEPSASHDFIPEVTQKRYTPNQDGVVVLNGVSIPSDFPYIDITINDNPDDGYIFANYEAEKYVNMILDNSGNPVFYWYVPDSRRDFKVQPTGVVTMTVREGFGGGGYIAVYESYTVVDTFFAPSGFQIDEHELLIKPDGNYLVTAMQYRTVNMSQIVPGGRPNATVIDYHLIEMDANDNPVFIWLCTDPGNYEITDAEYVDLQQPTIDYLHTNSIAVDLDGHYLISPKMLNEITKINRHTGEIMWRLGGSQNQFEYVDMEDFVYMQHSIRVLPNGNYTVFDNGMYHNPPYSRALEFRVDTTDMTVTKVWEFRDTPDKYAPYKGNVQRLPNGNTLINWGMEEVPKLMEVRPDGTKAFEMNFQNHIQCYRVHRFHWQSNAYAPFLVAETFTDRVTLLFNKFGDPDVVEYRVYGGPTSNPTTLLRTTSNPYINLDENDFTESQTYYFRVTAMDSYGNKSAFSNEERVRTNFIPVNRNMVNNSDFNSGIGGWNLNVQGSASAAISTSNFECHFEIAQGGSDLEDIRLTQGNLTLYQGQTYSFEFDARADQGRPITAKVESSASPYINYGNIGPTYIQSTPNRFVYAFEMQNATTHQARIVFYVGSSDNDVVIDDVVLKRLDPTDVPTEPKNVKPADFKLYPAFPNPFNSATQIVFSLPSESDIRLTIYDTLGRKVKTLVEGLQSAGNHTVTFNADDLTSGMYLCVLESGTIRTTRKIIFMK